MLGVKQLQFLGKPTPLLWMKVGGERVDQDQGHEHCQPAAQRAGLSSPPLAVRISGLQFHTEQDSMQVGRTAPTIIVTAPDTGFK